MKDKIIEAISKFNMIGNGDTIVIGVSGGADSMALLDFLIKFSKQSNIKVLAVHINHCLRGKESERDEQFVRNFCLKNNIPLKVYKINVKKLSDEQKIGLEECGRKVRYKTFSKLANEYNAKIATAHTLSDNIETVLMNMARGTGLNGLCGIPAVRGNIIRPLLLVTRKEIEEYCNKNNLSYITDSSNLTRDYNRNKVRLDVVPVMKEVNSSFEASMQRLLEQVKEDNDYLNMLAQEKVNDAKLKYGYDVQFISSLPYSLKSRIIFKIILKETKLSPEKKHIDKINSLFNLKKGKINISGGFFAIVEHGVFYILSDKLKNTNWKYRLNESKILTDSEKTFIIKVITIEEYNKLIVDCKKLIDNSLDYSVIKNNTFIRNRMQSDIFCSAKRGNTKTVKKLFNESKLPVILRDNIALIATENNVLWIDGFGVSKYAAVNELTEKVLIIVSEGN